MEFAKFIRFGNNNKKKGDITPLLRNKKAFRKAVEEMAKPFLNDRIDKVVGIEARGFIFAGAIAYLLGAGVAIIRKGGKLPREVLQCECVDYTGQEKILEIHKDEIEKGERILVVDDWFETCGQARAAAELVEKLGGIIVGFSVLIDDTTKKARDFLADHRYRYLITSHKEKLGGD